jgi:hypothetical protein
MTTNLKPNYVNESRHLRGDKVGATALAGGRSLIPLFGRKNSAVWHVAEFASDSNKISYL